MKKNISNRAVKKHFKKHREFFGQPLNAGEKKEIKAMGEIFKPILEQKKINNAYIESKIAEIINLDTPFGRMINKLNKGIAKDKIEEIKAAGVEINAYGGIFSMREALEFFVKPEFRRLVDVSWDGIGEWRS